MGKKWMRENKNEERGMRQWLETNMIKREEGKIGLVYVWKKESFMQLKE